jgi:threonine/homoserine/homoserine lactone efflux protein
MILDNYLLFVQLFTILFITPGPQKILIITNSMNYGFPKVYGLAWEMYGRMQFR